MAGYGAKSIKPPLKPVWTKTLVCMGSKGGRREKMFIRACEKEREIEGGGGRESEVVPLGNRHGAHSRLSAMIWPGKFGNALCN